MTRLKRNIFIAALLSATLLNSGCATIQKAKRVDELEREITQLRQLIKEKDSQISRLQELFNDQKMQLQDRELSYKKTLEGLNKELNELKAKPKALEKKQAELPPKLK
ncbi:MAG: hypothetical protein ABIH40_05155 [Candidatus Omnitrophota bacterium]